MTAWILVANSSRARLFSAVSPTGPIQEVEGFAHPEARVHEQELTSDLPGRTFDSAGQGRHAMEVKVGPKEQEQINFAGQLGKYLEQGRVGHSYDHLFLVVTPAFLGLIRQKLTRETASLADSQIDKDLTLHTAEEIRNHLPERLW